MFLPGRRNARRIIWPATRPPGNSASAAPPALRLYYQQINSSFVFASYFVLSRFCFCFFSFALDGNKKLSGGERSGYNLFYSRLARNSAVDGWTPIYPHLSVINVNGLVSVGACERARSDLAATTPCSSAAAGANPRRAVQSVQRLQIMHG